MSEHISYDAGEGYGDAVFSRRCPQCGRFVKADKIMNFRGIYPVAPNATCSKCGRVTMDFEGYL